MEPVAKNVEILSDLKVKNKGVFNTKNPPKRKTLVFLYIELGLTRNAIAELFIVSETTVNIWMRDYKIYKNKPIFYDRIVIFLKKCLDFFKKLIIK